MQAAGIGSLAVLGLQGVLVVIWIVGIVFALVRWRQHPRVSLLIACALAVLVGIQILDLSVPFLPSILGSRLGAGLNSFTILVMVWGTIRTLFVIAAWIMILVAIFSGRSATPATPKVE